MFPSSKSLCDDVVANERSTICKGDYRPLTSRFDTPMAMKAYVAKVSYVMLLSWISDDTYSVYLPSRASKDRDRDRSLLLV